MGVCSGRLEWAAGGGLSGQSKCTIACLLQQQQQQQKVVVGSSTSTSATAVQGKGVGSRPRRCRRAMQMAAMSAASQARQAGRPPPSRSGKDQASKQSSKQRRQRMLAAGHPARPLDMCMVTRTVHGLCPLAVPRARVGGPQRLTCACPPELDWWRAKQIDHAAGAEPESVDAQEQAYSRANKSPAP